MLKCRDLAELSSDYLNGELSRRRRLSVRLHLLLCRHCRRFMRQLKLTIDSVGRLPENEFPAELLDRQANKLRRYRRYGGDNNH